MGRGKSTSFKNSYRLTRDFFCSNSCFSCSGESSGNHTDLAIPHAAAQPNCLVPRSVAPDICFTGKLLFSHFWFIVWIQIHFSRHRFVKGHEMFLVLQDLETRFQASSCSSANSGAPLCSSSDTDSSHTKSFVIQRSFEQQFPLRRGPDFSFPVTNFCSGCCCFGCCAASLCCSSPNPQRGLMDLRRSRSHPFVFCDVAGLGAVSCWLRAPAAVSAADQSWRSATKQVVNTRGAPCCGHRSQPVCVGVIVLRPKWWISLST